MIKGLIKTLAGKKICILGFGREGKSTYNFLKNHRIQAEITIADKNPVSLENQGEPTLKTGESYLEGLENFDIIIKTPGISLKDYDFSPFKDKISSQMDLFLQVAPNKVIGITGTKGKSTTSTLLYEVIKNCGREVILAGNIGIPVFDIIDDIKPDTIIILELSSHQLEYIKHSPGIGVFLNIYKEHLDHYNSYEDYIDAKCNIFRFQKPDGIVLYNSSQEIIRRKINQYLPKSPWAVSLEKTPGHTAQSYTYTRDGDIYMETASGPASICPADLERKLPGEHNLLNILFLLSITRHLNLDIKPVLEAVAVFPGLPHRLEFVDTIKGITYYNDSIATIPEAAIYAVKSLHNVETIIAGGMNRGIDYEDLACFLARSAVKNILLLPETGELLKELIQKEKPGSPKNIILFASLEEAVENAKKITSPGSICLLSPAAPSYGYFKNFEERGDRFKSCVRAEN